MTIELRAANAADAAAIARIHNQGIEDRVATFETEPRSAAQVEALLVARAGSHPAVVAGDADGVVGFAWVSPYSDRDCYRGIGDFSVYVARGRRGTGVGRLLVEALAEACRERGFWKLLSKIFPENEASRALCRVAGFSEVGVHHRHAQLDGVWRDVIVVERLL